MNKTEELLITQERLLDRADFYLDAFKNESPIRTDMTEKTSLKEFLKGESLEDVGFFAGVTEEGASIFEQHWSGNKILQFMSMDREFLGLKLLLCNEEVNRPGRKLSQAIGLLEEALRVQTDIDELESGCK